MRIIGGKYRGKKLLPPIHEGTRPTSDRTRETIFNILLNNPSLGPQILRDKAVLDVFAGTGALGLEALSRGAKSVTFIENSRDVLPILQANIKACELPPTFVLEQDGRLLGANPYPPFDLIFMDPPYHQDMILPTLAKLESNGWMGKAAVVLMEISKDETLYLPSFLSLEVERISGAAKLLFCLAAL
ncbi:MAG: 16S rRNA (guanine(966)-N(2))-methyltransferase RsmD [Alphaproteobacteria bacterium]|nr:16S rRNA (guanine(966)-N(2))-methyltransferase RsmD [Alphaproteobacteria bacterium]